MMSRGLQAFFTNIPLTVLGMLIFITTFLAVGAYLFLRRSASAEYRALAQLPLRQEEVIHE